MPVLSIRIVLDSFFLLIFYSEKFSTHVCRLPYSANVNLNLSIVKKYLKLGYAWYLRATGIFGNHFPRKVFRTPRAEVD